MHILFLLPYVPSLVRVRSYQFIRGLLRRGNHIVVVAPIESDDDVHAAEMLRALGAEVVTHLLSASRKTWNCVFALSNGAPLQASFAWHPKLLHTAAEILREGRVDAVHIEHLRAARYLRAMRPLLSSQTPLVWDAVDSITHLFEQTVAHAPSRVWRSIARFELERTRRCEQSMLLLATHAVVTSGFDRDRLTEGADPDAAPVSVIPNGVDLRLFRAIPGSPRERFTIVFSGRMSYHANVAAVMRLAQRILPRVRAVQPAARLVIVGRDPSPAVRALERNVEGVVVTGAVADIAEHVRRAAVAAVPLVYGAGVQNKVLEAMACETPVVADPLATRALDPSCRDALCIAADDASFAAHILRLFDDDALRARLGAAGRSFVERFHSWDGAATSLEDVYRTSLANAVHRRGLAFARLA